MQKTAKECKREGGCVAKAAGKFKGGQVPGLRDGRAPTGALGSPVWTLLPVICGGVAAGCGKVGGRNMKNGSMEIHELSRHLLVRFEWAVENGRQWLVDSA
jgi:hypothetical protein